jgi:monofunctional biosynthetic peptidoglycan transglycosylase
LQQRAGVDRAAEPNTTLLDAATGGYKTRAMSSEAKTSRRRRSSRVSVWIRRAAKAMLWLLVAVVLSMALFRFINPPITPLMVAKYVRGYSVSHPWVPLEDISPNLPLAVMASEDGRFCQHWGVDWAAVNEAIKESRRRGKFRGASTITMQTAKNLYLWPGRSYLRKALEVPIAYLMTVLWGRERVMETYLNIVQWGPGIFGAEAAAQRYFGKSAKNLTRREALLLAASLPLPNIRNPAKPSARMLAKVRSVERWVPVIAKRADCVLPKPQRRKSTSGQRSRQPL